MTTTPAPAPDFARLGTHNPTWLQDSPLSIFIHWGAYSVPGWAEPHGELGADDDVTQWFTHCAYAEWYFNTMRIEGSPCQVRHRDLYGALEYDSFLDAWRTDRFDAHAWTDLFKRAGAGLVIATTKHHDGITLWNAPETGTRNTVMRGPRRDLVGEIAQATTAAGLRFGVYYSGGLDWHYRPTPPITGRADFTATARPIDRAYGRYCFLHVKDLIDRYSPDVFWNDIDWPDEAKDFSEFGLGTLFEHFYTARPEGVVNGRFGGVHMDFDSSEYQMITEAEKAGGAWEQCRGIGLSFGYNREEGPEQYLDGAAAAKLLTDCVARGGRLLLNVGPKADGTLPDEQVQTLEDLGAWMDDALPELCRVSRNDATPSSDEPGRWVRFISHDDHVTVIADPGEFGDLPGGVDWNRAATVTPGAAVSFAEGLLTLSGPSAMPLVATAPRA